MGTHSFSIECFQSTDPLFLNLGAVGIMALQTESKFAAAYHSGVGKMDYWESNLEDCLDVIARLPEVAALIYRTKFHDGKVCCCTTLNRQAVNYTCTSGRSI